MDLAFKVGDKVRLRADCGLDFRLEEARLNTPYVIGEIKWSSSLHDWYAQLEGIYSSYAFEWIEKIE